MERPGLLGGDNNPESRSGTRRRSTLDGGQKIWEHRIAQPDTITGYACACPEPPTAPVRPANVVDPFAGTGTTMLAASVLGRTGIRHRPIGRLLAAPPSGAPATPASDPA